MEPLGGSETGAASGGDCAGDGTPVATGVSVVETGSAMGGSDGSGDAPPVSTLGGVFDFFSISSAR